MLWSLSKFGTFLRVPHIRLAGVKRTVDFAVLCIDIGRLSPRACVFNPVIRMRKLPWYSAFGSSAQENVLVGQRGIRILSVWRVTRSDYDRIELVRGL